MSSPSPVLRRSSSQRRALPPLPSPPRTSSTSQSSRTTRKTSPVPSALGVPRSSSAAELRSPQRQSLALSDHALTPLAGAPRQGVCAADISLGGCLEVSPSMPQTEEKAVLERVVGMLTEMHQQYAERLAALDSGTTRQARLASPKSIAAEPCGAVLVGSVSASNVSPETSLASPTTATPSTSLAAAAAPPLLEQPVIEAGASSAVESGEEDDEDEVEAVGAATEQSGQREHDHVENEVGTDDGSARVSAVPAPPRDSKAKRPAGSGKKTSKKKHSKKKDGIHCIKTVQFEGSTAVRCALAVGDEVWTADWAGRLLIRDRENFEKVKAEPPSNGLVWCMTLVQARYPMIWVGQERAGIPIFHATTRELLCTVTGGHTGNVVAFAVADGPNCRVDVWSASNDFSVRCWHVEAGRGSGGCAVALPGKPYMQVRRGAVLFWHSNSVRCLLRIGPTLWSGSDDKAIVVWRCADGERLESVQDAHEAGVMCLVVAGRGVWSSGFDGRVKEWTIGGVSRECTRVIKLDEPLRALVPVGHYVWLCGQSKNIAVYSSDMRHVDSLEGHSSFVSSLILVDRVETQLLWSSSLADRTLRVWRHVLRQGAGALSEAELTAANLCYQEHQWQGDSKLHHAEALLAASEAELAAASAEFSSQLESVLSRAATNAKDRDEAEAARARAEEREAAAREAERFSKAEAAELRRLLADAEAARREAEANAVAQAAEAADQVAARQRAEAERDDALQQASELRGSLQTECSRAKDLSKQLDRALALIQSGDDSTKSLQAQLDEMSADLEGLRGSLSEEASRREAAEERASELADKLDGLERERDEAQARERQLEMRYAELDVFKLDVIARELKLIDRSIDSMRSEARGFQDTAKKFMNANDQQASMKVAISVFDASTRLRGTIRDVIERCLSETQKLHVGAAIKDPTAAGVLKNGGKMAGYVSPESPGQAGGGAGGGAQSQHPRQQDELRRERRNLPPKP
eukprot:TRINITY_DN55079_c0_g1_i1.p1 TRINITY_DN55079_c0_g1~~TRINITY_DN55079_c0_g1_i1.p1  ORF type:complete len:982 (+),score=197.37 TRINITY_DN55079_c0_g1_i1:189-3134(+)